MSKVLDSRINDLQRFGRYKVGQQIRHEISILMAIESRGFIYRTRDLLDTLDFLTIGLVANKYTKVGKTSENLILFLGLSYIKIPLCQGINQTFESLAFVSNWNWVAKIEIKTCNYTIIVICEKDWKIIKVCFNILEVF